MKFEFDLNLRLDDQVDMFMAEAKIFREGRSPGAGPVTADAVSGGGAER